MSNEFIKAETFTDVSPGKTLTSTRANNMQEGLKAAVGMIANKTELAANATAVGDMMTVQDVSDGAAAEPKKVQLQNMLPEVVRQGTQLYAAGTLSGGVYSVTLSPAATAYTAGMLVVFKADLANAGAVDINVNGIGAKNLFTRAGGEHAANDILASQVVLAVYDGTQFQVLTVISAAEITATHLIEVNRHGVHQYIADTGAADAYVTTLSPAATAYTAGMVIRFKAANANTGAATVNVNGLGAKNLKKVVAGAVAVLLARDIQVADIVEAVYDGTQFVITSRIRSWDFVGTGAVPGTTAATAIAHGLGFVPTKLRVVLLQNTGAAQQGYAQNDEVPIENVQNAANDGIAVTVSADATNVTIARMNSGAIQVVPKTGLAVASITDANWLLKVYASL